MSAVRSRPARGRTARTSVDRLRAICLALPEATEKIAHGEPTWRVGGKMFATLDDHHHGADRLAVWLAAALGDQEALVASDPSRFFVPPYVGHRGWIGVRIDGAVYKDYTVPPYYDALLAKLTVRGRTWEETVSRMRRSLEEYVLRGLKTTIPFMEAIMQEPDFIAGRFDTSYLDTHPELYSYHEFEQPEDLVLALSAAIAAYEGL